MPGSDPAERLAGDEGGGGRGSVTRFLIHGTVVVLAARGGAVVAGLAVQFLLARLLSPEELGAYFLTQSVITVAALFGQLGLARTIVRFVAEASGAGESGRAHSAIRRGMTIALVACAAATAIYAAGGDVLARRVFESPVMATGTLMAAAWMAGITFQAVAASALRGLHRVGAAALVELTLSSVLTAMALGLLLYFQGRAEFVRVLLVSAAASWISIGIALLMVRWALGPDASKGPGDAVPFEALLRSAVPLAATSLGHAGIAQGDLWILGALSGAEDVALYGAAKRLIRVVSFPLVIIGLVVPPVIADLYARGERPRLQRAIRGSATLAGLPALTVLVVLLLVSGEALELVYGPYYREASRLLAILCVERLVFVAVGPGALVLMMTGHERLLMRLTLGSGVVAVLLIYLGARLGGVTGLAFGFAAGSMLRQVLIWNEVRTRVGFRSDIDLLNLRAMVEAARRALQPRRKGPAPPDTSHGED